MVHLSRDTLASTEQHQLTRMCHPQDPLHASAGDKVKSLGICSGDVIWILAQDRLAFAETHEAPQSAEEPLPCKLQKTEHRLPSEQEHASSSAAVGRTTPSCLARAVHDTLLEGGLQRFKVIPSHAYYPTCLGCALCLLRYTLWLA